MRAGQIAGRLDAAGAPGSAALEGIRAAGSLPTRTHFARALVALGAARDLPEAFERWLGRGRPGHVAGDWPSLAEATAWIVEAGGKAVIAHPMRYPLSAGGRRDMCAEFVAAGGRGVEVMTGGGSPRDREAAIALAVRCRLEGSVGSDFHDPAVPWNPPGRLAKLPDRSGPCGWTPHSPSSRPTPAGMTDEEKVNTELFARVQRLRELRIEHRDLDDVICRLSLDIYVDELQLRRLKRRKLLLKDRIQRLESELIPDLNA